MGRLWVGWYEPWRMYSFPMHDSAGDVVGIRLRGRDGRKLSVRASVDGIFMPRDLVPGEPLLIAEGASDAACGLDLDFPTIGRPSCRGAITSLVCLTERLRPRFAVIVGDGDGPGRAGAAELAERLTTQVDVRTIFPPCKDFRDWVQGGARRADVLALIRKGTS